jgi:hypothetical protein
MQELGSYIFATLGAIMGVPLLVGIFALIMLQNPKVKAGFQEAEAGPDELDDEDEDEEEEDDEDAPRRKKKESDSARRAKKAAGVLGGMLLGAVLGDEEGGDDDYGGDEDEPEDEPEDEDDEEVDEAEDEEVDEDDEEDDRALVSPRVCGLRVCRRGGAGGCRRGLCARRGDKPKKATVRTRRGG